METKTIIIIVAIVVYMTIACFICYRSGFAHGKTYWDRRKEIHEVYKHWLFFGISILWPLGLVFALIAYLINLAGDILFANKD